MRYKEVFLAFCYEREHIFLECSSWVLLSPVCVASLMRWPRYILSNISVAGIKDNVWGEQRNSGRLD